MNNKEHQVVSRVTGFIEPIFIGVGPDGKTLNGVGPDDWKMIQEGYACGECLATFNTYTIVCPVCHTNRQIEIVQDIPPPQEWVDRISEWQKEDRGEGTAKPPLRSPLEAIYGVKDDPDVEHVHVSKLRKRRR